MTRSLYTYKQYTNTITKYNSETLLQTFCDSFTQFGFCLCSSSVSERERRKHTLKTPYPQKTIYPWIQGPGTRPFPMRNGFAIPQYHDQGLCAAIHNNSNRSQQYKGVLVFLVQKMFVMKRLNNYVTVVVIRSLFDISVEFWKIMIADTNRNLSKNQLKTEYQTNGISPKQQPMTSPPTNEIKSYLIDQQHLRKSG